MTDVEAQAADPLLAAAAPVENGNDPASEVGPSWSDGSVSVQFPTILGVLLAACIGVFAFCAKYAEGIDTELYYQFYTHVAVMIFIGFGFLMTFMRRYSLGAVSLNFVASCLMMLLAIICHSALTSDWSSIQFISMDLSVLIQGLFCAGAGMITFGALLGKVSPLQIVVLLTLETIFYCFNAEKLVGGYFGDLGAQDFGGSLAIHAFGAYFGLAASWYLFKGSADTVGAEHPKNGSGYINDVTAMIGTVFLWIYWPSFNAVTSILTTDDAVDVDGTAKLRMYASVNTILSLCGACISTFAASALLETKLNMVHVQNATLAGGVAIGSACTMVVGKDIVNVGPGIALLVGSFAGILSTAGYKYILPYLEENFGLTDTCGVHNLHGMPAVLGGLVAAASLAYQGYMGAAIAQVEALVATVVIAAGSGLICAAGVDMLETLEDLAGVVYNDFAVFAEVEDEE